MILKFHNYIEKHKCFFFSNWHEYYNMLVLGNLHSPSELETSY